MGNNRDRGNRYERELVNEFKDAGVPAERTWGSDGRSRGLIAEVDLILETKQGVKYGQAKRKKRIPAYLEPVDGIDIQVIRADRSESLVGMRISDYIALIKPEKDNATLQETRREDGDLHDEGW